MAIRHLMMLAALNGWWINRLKIATYNTDIFKINVDNNKLIKNLSKKMQIFYANMIKSTWQFSL